MPGDECVAVTLADCSTHRVSTGYVLALIVARMLTPAGRRGGTQACVVSGKDLIILDSFSDSRVEVGLRSGVSGRMASNLGAGMPRL